MTTDITKEINTSATIKKTTTKKAQSRPRAKTIKLKDIQSQQKLVNKMESFTLDEEKNLKIKFYPIFPESKIQELLTEAYASIVYVEENELDFFTDDSQFLKYVYFLIIRHFTSLESEIPLNDFPSHVNIMEQIIDIGLFKRLHDEVLPEEESYKVVERLQEFVSLTERIGELTKEELAKLENQIDNPDVMHPLANPFNDAKADVNG